MLDPIYHQPPAALEQIQQATAAIGFTISSDMLTGSLLRTLAATKPGGTLLELGTGTGHGTAWLLDGMNSSAHLITVDISDQHASVARRFLEQDKRVEFLLQDGVLFLQQMGEQGRRFDLIFADFIPGKYQQLSEALDLLAPGGIYIVDDLHFSAAESSDSTSRVFNLVTTLEQRQDLHITKLNWSTGLLVATRHQML